jgi:hypothetical protein
MERSPYEGTPSVSVVVPVLDEASRLPGLLDCLDRQSLRPVEVVIADAGSTDGTAEIARSRGVHVVAGGRPAVGRNAGAREATGDLILFLDADCEPSPHFIELAVAEFVARGLSVTGARVAPIERSLDYIVACWAAGIYLRTMQHVAPHAAGACMLVRRDVHERIGGFDESLMLAEDHDYVRRASKCGRFRILNRVALPVSMRRVEQEGRIRLGLKYAYCELRTLLGLQIREMPFAYEFAAYDDKPVNTALEKARASRAPGAGHFLPRGLRRFARTLEEPSTELQADAIGIAVTTVFGSGAASAALAAAGAAPRVYLPLTGVAVAAAGLSAYEAGRKFRYEHHYGEFFMASIAVASADIVGDDGTMLAARGIDEIWELHAISGFGRMSQLSLQGPDGRLTVVLETLEGLRDMLEDPDIELYEGAKVVTARSDLVTWLVKMGFDQVSDPPPYDLANRLDKRMLTRVLAQRTRRDGAAGLEGYRLAVMSTARFLGPEFRAALDAQITRVRSSLARARSRSERVNAKPVPDSE